MTTPTLHQAAQVALDALEPLSAYGRVGTSDVDQAALQQVCAALREALAQPQAEPVDQQIESINAVFDAWRNGEDASMTLALSAPPADGDRVEAAIDDYIDGYVMEGDDGYYQPNDGDTAMLKDAMMGLLVDPGFLAAYDATPPAAPQAVPAPAVREPLTLSDDDLLRIATTLGLPFGMLDTDYCKSMEIEPGTRSYGEVTCDGMVRFARAAIAAAHGITGGTHG